MTDLKALLQNPSLQSTKLAPKVSLAEHNFSDKRVADDVPLLLLLVDILIEREASIKTSELLACLKEIGLDSANLFKKKYSCEFAEWLTRFPDYFLVSNKSVSLAPHAKLIPATPAKISNSKRRAITSKLVKTIAESGQVNISKFIALCLEVGVDLNHFHYSLKLKNPSHIIQWLLYKEVKIKRTSSGGTEVVPVRETPSNPAASDSVPPGFSKSIPPGFVSGSDAPQLNSPLSSSSESTSRASSSSSNRSPSEHNTSDGSSATKWLGLFGTTYNNANTTKESLQQSSSPDNLLMDFDIPAPLSSSLPAPLPSSSPAPLPSSSPAPLPPSLPSTFPSSFPPLPSFLPPLPSSSPSSLSSASTEHYQSVADSNKHKRKPFAIHFDSSFRPQYNDASFAEKMEKKESSSNSELYSILYCIQQDVGKKILKVMEKSESEIRTIIMDVGRDILLRFADKTTMHVEHVVQTAELTELLTKLTRITTMDNRSAYRVDSKGLSDAEAFFAGPDVFNVTLNIKRHITTFPILLTDVIANISGVSPKSLLVTGAQGTGKTTLLCQIALKLSSDKNKNIRVVDRHNEMGGEDGSHERIGFARCELSGTTLRTRIHDAVHKHHADVLIVDNIATEEEVKEVVKAIKSGITVVASVQSDCCLEDNVSLMETFHSGIDIRKINKFHIFHNLPHFFSQKHERIFEKRWVDKSSNMLAGVKDRNKTII